MPNKQDSNSSGLRYALETSLRVLPGTPNWIELEPNSFSDFGAQYSQVTRNSINARRSRRKGAVVDVDAGGGFNQDLSIFNTVDLLQGFFFAAADQAYSSQGLNTAAVPFTSTTATTYVAAGGLGFNVTTIGNLVYASGFAAAANNGLKLLSAATATTLTTTGLVVDAAPAATAKVETVGHQFAASALSIVMSGNLVRLTGTSMNTFGMVPGEWVFLGGDTALTRFVNNQGWARINNVTSTYWEFDKVSWTPQAEAAGVLTIQVFYGTIVKNQIVPANIVRRSYNLERTLGVGNAGALLQAEYLEGAVANEWTITVPQADKVTCDWSFVAIAHVLQNSTTGPKTGNRPTLSAGSAFNTANGLKRIRLSLLDPTTSTPTPLYAFFSDVSLTVNNNVSVNKALGVLGGFDVTAGIFDVSGSVSAYFADVDSLNAMKNNSSATLDFSVVQDNAGYVVDVPLLTLGDGRLDVQQDQAVMVPLETAAVESSFGHTAQVQHFAYLPTLAA